MYSSNSVLYPPISELFYQQSVGLSVYSPTFLDDLFNAIESIVMLIVLLMVMPLITSLMK